MGVAAAMTTPGSIALAFRLFTADGLRVRAMTLISTVGLGTILSLNPTFKMGYLPGLPDKIGEARVLFNPSWAVGVNAGISAEKKEAPLKFVDHGLNISIAAPAMSQKSLNCDPLS